MTIAQMRKQHDGEGVAICIPAKRNENSGFVESWKLLQLVRYLQDVEETLAFYEAEGLAEAVPISMSNDIEITEKLAAKYFRVLFGQNYPIWTYFITL